jgi:hypothetical protein
MSTKKSKARYRIRETAWGNWYGYLGSKRVECFGASSTETQQQAAERWLREKTLRDPRRIADALTVPKRKPAMATPAPDAWVSLVLSSMGDDELRAESLNVANTDAERDLMGAELQRRARAKR